MVFTSLKFLLFLCACVGVFYITPVKARGYMLLLFSIVFYCIAGLKFLPFILTATILSYLTARYISNKYEKLKLELNNISDREAALKTRALCHKQCKRILIIALIILIGLLFYTKFTGMIYDLIMSYFSTSGEWNSLYIIVPLGISYYTFSTVGYVLDVYWERYPAEKNFFKYALYVIYFPHILQGPIARYNKLGVQLFEEHRFDYKRVTFGIQLILWGFFQKIVIADRLSIFVKSVYDSYEDKIGSILVVATLFYAVQIYTDFSGCVDIAKGVSQIFGIELEDNFHQPYFSQSVAEFWRRWHITLGAWFKDYLCMPVAVAGWVKNLSQKARKKWGKQAGKNTVTLISLAAVWLCTGIWHGTGFNYVIWGLWQGGIIAISTLLEPKYKVWKDALHIKDSNKAWQLFRILRTFVLTGIIPRVITRAPSLQGAVVIFKRMLTQFDFKVFTDGTLFEYGLSNYDFYVALISILILFLVSLAKEYNISIREMIAKRNIVVRWAVYYLAFFLIVVFGIYGPGYDASSFVYMGF